MIDQLDNYFIVQEQACFQRAMNNVQRYKPLNSTAFNKVYCRKQDSQD